MTDMELADLIERKGVLNAVQSIAGTERKIIAALRRVPEPIDTRMADLLVDTTWRKAVGQCVADVCGLDGKPLGKRCDRLFISRERFDEHIAPLIRQCERPPSGEMVMVPREPTDAIVWAICEHSDAPIDRERCLRCPAKEPTYYGEGTRGCRALAEDQFRAMLSAAEAEGRNG